MDPFLLLGLPDLDEKASGHPGLSCSHTMRATGHPAEGEHMCLLTLVIEYVIANAPIDTDMSSLQQAGAGTV